MSADHIPDREQESLIRTSKDVLAIKLRNIAQHLRDGLEASTAIRDLELIAAEVDGAATETAEVSEEIRRRMIADEELSETEFEARAHRIALEAHEDRLKLWESLHTDKATGARLSRLPLKAAAPLTACINVPALIAQNNEAVDSAHNRLIRINELEAELARVNDAVTPETNELSRALHTIDEAGKLSDWINLARPVVTDLMQAYERRIRTDCTPEQLAKKPWRCMEYIAAERLLAAQPVAVVEITAVKAATPPSAIDEWNADVEQAKATGGEMPNDPK